MSPTRTTVTTTSDNTTPSLTAMSIRDVIGTFFCGIAAGVLTGVVWLLLNRYVFGAVLCRDGGAQCAQAPLFSMIVAMVVGMIAGVIGMAQLRVFRPLLAVIATVAALWGIQTWLMPMTWYWALVVLGLLFGLSYALFAWVSRIRSFILAIVVTVIAVVIVRLIM